jgi:hypothetical protein
MNSWQILSTVGGVMLAAVGGFMTITNPAPQDYEQYATEELTTYLKDNVCTQAPPDFGEVLRSYCKSMVDTGRPKIEQIIALQTRRQNFLLFSIYQTELSMPSPVPSYQFETLGMLHKFYTYQAEQL